MKYIIALLLIVLASYADIFLFRIGLVPAEPSVFFIPLFLVLCLIRYSILDILDLLNSHSFKFFLIVLFFSIIFSATSPADVEIITTNIFLNIITIVIYLFSVHFFRTENKKIVTVVMLLAFLSISGSVVYDFMIGLPRTNQKLIDAVRKGGFGENPNQAASAIKFLAFGALVFFQNKKTKRSLIILGMLISVFLTMSRSGLISVVLIIIFGIANNWQSKFQLNVTNLFKSIFKIALVFITLFIGLVFMADVIKNNFPAFTRGAAGERLDLLTGQSDKGVISEDIGSGGRGDLLFKYIDQFKRNPFGYGTEYTGTKHYNSLNTHNYYLFLAVNYGVLAFLIYLVYLGYSLRLAIKKEEFYYLVFVILIVFEGLISHSVYFERALLISLAFFDSLIYRTDNSRVLNKKWPNDKENLSKTKQIQ